MVDVLPLFPLGTVLFPGLLLPLQIFEPRYRMLMSDLMDGPEPWSFGVVAIREGHEVGPTSVKSLYDVGCIAVVQRAQQLEDGRFAVLLSGGERFTLVELDESRPYLQASIDPVVDPSPDAVPEELATKVREQFVDYLTGLGASTPATKLPADPMELSYLISATMLLPLADRQALLETPGTARRLHMEGDLLARELALMRTGTLPVTQPRLPPYSQN